MRELGVTRALPPPLLALSPGTLPEGRGELLLGRVRAARAQGLAGVLLREPAWRDAALLELAMALRELLPRDEAWFGVHDRVHVALAGFCGSVGPYVRRGPVQHRIYRSGYV